MLAACKTLAQQGAWRLAATNQAVGVYISQFCARLNCFQCFALPQPQPKCSHEQ